MIGFILKQMDLIWMVQYKDVPDYYFKKALALEKLGKYEEAIECYDKNIRDRSACSECLS